MKRITLLLVVLFLVACGQKPAEQVGDYSSFGAKISPEDAISSSEMLKKYESMKIGDTLDVKFASKVNAVCKKKGCWMDLELSPEEGTFVKFKDYDFFVPKNCEEDEAIVSGKAFINVTSVEELKHYAQDAGKSEEEIAKITAPKTEFAFMADGVLLK